MDCMAQLVDHVFISVMMADVKNIHETKAGHGNIDCWIAWCWNALDDGVDVIHAEFYSCHPAKPRLSGLVRLTQNHVTYVYILSAVPEEKTAAIGRLRKTNVIFMWAVPQYGSASIDRIINTHIAWFTPVLWPFQANQVCSILSELLWCRHFVIAARKQAAGRRPAESTFVSDRKLLTLLT